MTKNFGSKLAGSVRQARTNQPQNNPSSTKNTPAPVKSEAETPILIMASRRVWPD